MGRTVYYDHSGNEVEPPKADAVKPSNADRIRAMSDEELAEFLYVKTCEDGYPQFGTTQEWLDWLKQEAAQ